MIEKRSIRGSGLLLGAALLALAPSVSHADVDLFARRQACQAEAKTRLRKVGGRYTGLCPFHEERTPSFSVSPDRGTYHCFGCGVGGDAISFVRETEGLDFVGAIEWLADRFHVQVEYDDASPHADEQRRRRAARRASAPRRCSTSTGRFFQ